MEDLADCGRRAVAGKAAAESCQAVRVAGTLDAPPARTAEFLSQVAAACAE